MHNQRRFNLNLRQAATAVSAFSIAAALTGCAGTGPGSFGVSPTPTPSVHLTGQVMGGQQPVSGSTIQLYTVGTTGLKSASTALIGSTVVSDASGNFGITGLYSCTAATQVYITATGGNPGVGANSALTMVAALGDCATLKANAATTFIFINEVTTAAAAYALAPFAADITHIGASGSNPSGLLTAFANAAMLANTGTGNPGGAGLAPLVTVPTSRLNTLANILAACVNTSGSASSQCSTLFTATGATETFGAALAMAKAPAATATTGLFALSSGTAPFQPSLTSQPSDFTLAVTIGGNSFRTPYGIAIDATGNAWITNVAAGNITQISPTGTILLTANSSTQAGPQGIAVDKSGNVWVANTAGNNVIKLTIVGGAVNSTTPFAVGGVNAPTAIAIDSANNVFVTNFNGNSVTGLTSGGAALSGSPFTGNSKINVPTGIALDATGNIYVTSGTNGSPVVKLTNAGAFTASLSDFAIQGPASIAVDSSSRFVATGFTTGATQNGGLMESSTTGTIAPVSPVTTTFSNPAGVATDGTSFWVANSTASGGLSQFTYGSSTASAQLGSLNTPVGVAVDASGSVWTTNTGSNNLSKFIGIATPVVTPLAANVGP